MPRVKQVRTFRDDALGEYSVVDEFGLGCRPRRVFWCLHEVHDCGNCARGVMLQSRSHALLRLSGSLRGAQKCLLVRWDEKFAAHVHHVPRVPPLLFRAANLKNRRLQSRHTEMQIELQDP